ncbi:TPR repeat-containing thioredoxin TTL1-like [Actinidia eriantha]|uniref:TPR repeat-containing thioredoxin TTL1-like n=1 Tax=Actinidia eriantha TaxID=165200 RepID=UPI0025894C0E|nr:TPR repeat-containing thioredoxin TTL1-like [Actinidia eriantha]
MAETVKYQVGNDLGCGFMSAIFHFSLRKSSVKQLPENTRKSSINVPKLEEKPITKPISATTSRPSKRIVPQNQSRSSSDATRSSTSSSNSLGLKRQPTFTSAELSLITTTNHHRPPSDPTGRLFRASSGNIMLLGQLGNLKQQGTKTSSNNSINKPLDFHYKTEAGNIVRGRIGEKYQFDPEVLKSMGNEKYKQGRFEEALALYSKAISLDPNRASYHSNKSAALIGLGRLVEAAFECREAVRIEPNYLRAHHRLATLYLRLGEAEKALDHYKQSGLKADIKDTAKAQALKTHLNGCSKAKEQRDWVSLLKESQSAISSGADSAPQIYAMQIEALLKLHRHQEAHNIFQKGTNFDIDSCIRFFGPACSAYLLTIQAQVYMAAGRFEDAVAASQRAARLDLSNYEVNEVVKRAQAVALARSNGNKLFKVSRFSEAFTAYSEGLEHDGYNSILLCNRAACRYKLGQFEKAAEDCTAALYVQPSYSKARLRRANCNAKLERWEAAIQDYETLIRETPGDEEMGEALFEARLQQKKQHGEDTTDLKFGPNLVSISSNESFRHFVTAPGMSVVLFYNKTCHKKVLQLMDQVCKGFPSVNFLKVEIEDHPYLAKSEGVSSIPAFKIYKNGSKIKDIPGNNRELLESSVKLYSS